MDFDEIKNIFQQQIINHAVWIGEESEFVQQRRLNINEIRLNMMVVAQPNNQQEYIAIPVWDFIGYEVLKYSDAYLKEPERYILDENNEREVRYGDNYSYLTINAIDGTVISRAEGY
ncbi:MAG: hypothetical protein GX815_00615 [Clostridiales bacterium]|nr:hypothetical protein [Clostridiales bacterium]